MSRCPSGKVAACKAAYGGSNPSRDSIWHGVAKWRRPLTVNQVSNGSRRRFDSCSCHNGGLHESGKWPGCYPEAVRKGVQVQILCPPLQGRGVNG